MRVGGEAGGRGEGAAGSVGVGGAGGMEFERAVDGRDSEDRLEPLFGNVVARGAGTVLAVDEANQCVKEFNPSCLIVDRYACAGLQLINYLLIFYYVRHALTKVHCTVLILVSFCFI